MNALVCVEVECLLCQKTLCNERTFKKHCLTITHRTNEKLAKKQFRKAVREESTNSESVDQNIDDEFSINVSETKKRRCIDSGGSNNNNNNGSSELNLLHQQQQQCNTTATVTVVDYQSTVLTNGNNSTPQLLSSDERSSVPATTTTTKALLVADASSTTKRINLNDPLEQQQLLQQQIQWQATHRETFFEPIIDAHANLCRAHARTSNRLQQLSTAADIDNSSLIELKQITQSLESTHDLCVARFNALYSDMEELTKSTRNLTRECYATIGKNVALTSDKL